jgi:hypothetical protein
VGVNHLPSKLATQSLAGIRSEVERERVRQEVIEQQLLLQATQLEALRREIAALRLGQPSTDELVLLEPGKHSSPPRLVELPRESAETGPAYWLRRCEGFEVHVGAKLLGTVEGVRFGSRHDRPDMLIVAFGIRRSILRVPVELIEEISPDEQLVMLSADPRHQEPAVPRGDHALVDALTRRLRRLHVGAP